MGVDAKWREPVYATLARPGGVNMQQEIERHYTSEDIGDRVLAAVREAYGPDVRITPDALAPLDQFHGRGRGGDRGAERSPCAEGG